MAGFLREQKGKLKSKFGYSFTQKAGDRLNNSWNTKEELSIIFAKIWAKAIKEENRISLTEYFAMLQDDEAWVDAEFAENYILKETAVVLKQHLLQQDLGTSLFFCESLKNKKV